MANKTYQAGALFRLEMTAISMKNVLPNASQSALERRTIMQLRLVREEYCEMYSDHYGSGPSASALSPLGYQWFDATRKCLQQQLVELLRYPNSTNCTKIKEAAFNSHPGCYVNPQLVAPGICDLSLKDWLNIFRVTLSALTTDHVYYVSQAWAVALSCEKELLQKGIRKIRTSIQSLGKSRIKRFAPGYHVSNETLEQFYFALRLAESMSRLLEWDKTVMD